MFTPRVGIDRATGRSGLGSEVAGGGKSDESLDLGFFFWLIVFSFHNFVFITPGDKNTLFN